jgi:glutamine cyclotransferase
MTGRRDKSMSDTMKRTARVLGAFFLLALGLLAPAPTEARGTTRTYTYKVVASYPHDRAAFTQGLVYLDGTLYEGTGLYGQSSLRRYPLGAPLDEQTADMVMLDARYFGEGIAVVGEQIFQLTWREGVGLIYDRSSLAQTGEFRYNETSGTQEGWGLTYDGSQLILSDGTDILTFLDPLTLERHGSLAVRDGSSPVLRLNELEYVGGKIYANIWLTDRIAIINPASGLVEAWIDLTGLLPASDGAGADVLNGIAYDPAGDRLFVTGKLWPTLFEIDLVPTPQTALPLVVSKHTIR